MTTASPARPVLPKRYAPVLFALLMSMTLSFCISLVFGIKLNPVDAQFVGKWLPAWGLAWALAFPLVIVVGPRVKRIVDHLTT